MEEPVFKKCTLYFFLMTNTLNMGCCWFFFLQVLLSKVKWWFGKWENTELSTGNMKTDQESLRTKMMLVKRCYFTGITK